MDFTVVIRRSKNPDRAKRVPRQNGESIKLRPMSSVNLILAKTREKDDEGLLNDVPLAEPMDKFLLPPSTDTCC